jgi:hypothetical protein
MNKETFKVGDIIISNGSVPIKFKIEKIKNNILYGVDSKGLIIPFKKESICTLEDFKDYEGVMIDFSKNKNYE